MARTCVRPQITQAKSWSHVIMVTLPGVHSSGLLKAIATSDHRLHIPSSRILVYRLDLISVGPTEEQGSPRDLARKIKEEKCLQSHGRGIPYQAVAAG